MKALQQRANCRHTEVVPHAVSGKTMLLVAESESHKFLRMQETSIRDHRAVSQTHARTNNNLEVVFTKQGRSDILVCQEKHESIIELGTSFGANQ